MQWKGWWRNWLWYNLRYCPAICLDTLEKYSNNLSQDIWSQNQGLSTGPCVYNMRSVPLPSPQQLVLHWKSHLHILTFYWLGVMIRDCWFTVLILFIVLLLLLLLLTCTRTRTHTHTHACTHTHAHAHTHTHTRVHTHAHTHMRVHTHTHTLSLFLPPPPPPNFALSATIFLFCVLYHRF